VDFIRKRPAFVRDAEPPDEDPSHGRYESWLAIEPADRAGSVDEFSTVSKRTAGGGRRRSRVGVELSEFPGRLSIVRRLRSTISQETDRRRRAWGQPALADVADDEVEDQ